MNFQDIPVIFDILKEENLKPIISPVEGDKIVCEEAGGDKYLMKDIRGIEQKVFEDIFPVIERQN